MLAQPFTTHPAPPAANTLPPARPVPCPPPAPAALQAPAAERPSDAELMACWDCVEPVLERWLAGRGFGRQVARDAVAQVRPLALGNIASGWAGSVSSHHQRCWAWKRARQWATTLTQRQRRHAGLADRDDGSFARREEDETAEALAALVRAAALKLSPNRRRALGLRFDEDMTYREVAEELDISPESARDRLRGALSALAPILAEMLRRPEFDDIRQRFPRLDEFSE